MKAKLLVALFVLGIAPTATLAECYGGHEDVTMSCPEGQSFDPASKSCITPTG